MSDNLYFRIKDNGTTVFGVENEARKSRIDFQPIATENTRNGDLKPRKEAGITEDERTAIEAWLEARRTTLVIREGMDAQMTLERINAAAGWFSSKPDQVADEAVADEMLLALHDLRSAIVRFKSKSLNND